MRYSKQLFGAQVRSEEVKFKRAKRCFGWVKRNEQDKLNLALNPINARLPLSPFVLLTLLEPCSEERSYVE
jgi:hypothetical protein